MLGYTRNVQVGPSHVVMPAHILVHYSMRALLSGRGKVQAHNYNLVSRASRYFFSGGGSPPHTGNKKASQAFDRKLCALCMHIVKRRGEFNYCIAAKPGQSHQTLLFPLPLRKKNNGWPARLNYNCAPHSMRRNFELHVYSAMCQPL